MKTIFLSFLTCFSLSTLFAQFEIASIDGIPPLYLEQESSMPLAKSEPAVSAYAYTVDDIALISLGNGFKQAVNLQMLSPDMDVVVNQEVAAGQKKVKVDLAGLGDGTYIVRIRVGDRTFVRQVVKK